MWISVWTDHGGRGHRFKCIFRSVHPVVCYQNSKVRFPSTQQTLFYSQSIHQWQSIQSETEFVIFYLFILIDFITTFVVLMEILPCHSYAYLKYWRNYLSLIFLLLATDIKYLFWRFSGFLLKLSLDIPSHLRSTENTTMEPGSKAATVPQTLRVKMRGAVKR